MPKIKVFKYFTLEYLKGMLIAGFICGIIVCAFYFFGGYAKNAKFEKETQRMEYFSKLENISKENENKCYEIQVLETFIDIEKYFIIIDGEVFDLKHFEYKDYIRNNNYYDFLIKVVIKNGKNKFVLEKRKDVK